MSARSCQLCGKPLSRIWVGSDGDFCSREHRNQYRLRQGMDRLQEANKVANVMRRREQLKPLAHACVAKADAISRRGFFQVRMGIGLRRAASQARIPMHLAPVQIRTESPRFIAPQPSASQTSPLPASAAPPRFAATRRPRFLQRSMPPLRARIQAASAAESTQLVRKPHFGKREFGMARTMGRKLVFSRNRIRETGVVLPGKTPKASPGTRNTAVRGNALRVSSSCGFRLRAPVRRYRPVPAHLSSGLQWEEKHTAAAAMRPRRLAKLVSPAVAIPLREIRTPQAPDALHSSQWKPRTIPLRRPAPVLGASIAPRSTEANWSTPAEGLFLPQVILQNWKPGHATALPHIANRPSPVTGRGQSKHTLAPFVPQDVPCGPQFSVGQNGNKDQKR